MTRLVMDDRGNLALVEDDGRVVDAVRIDQDGKSVPTTPTDDTRIEFDDPTAPAEPTSTVRYLAGLLAIITGALVPVFLAALFLLWVVFP